MNENKNEKSTKIIISVRNDILSVDELKKLAQCIREIEQNNPSRHIDMLIDVPEKTVKELEEVMNSVNPEFPFKKTIRFDGI